MHKKGYTLDQSADVAENNHTAKGKEIGYVYRIKRHKQNIWKL